MVYACKVKFVNLSNAIRGFILKISIPHGVGILLRQTVWRLRRLGFFALSPISSRVKIHKRQHDG